MRVFLMDWHRFIYSREVGKSFKLNKTCREQKIAVHDEVYSGRVNIPIISAANGYVAD